jgi:hypothetical protein
MPRWQGNKEPVAVGELVGAIESDVAFQPDERQELLTLLDES